MYLIVGLGNKGEKYEKTRHNVGFLVLDIVAQKLQKSKTPSFQTSNKFQSSIVNHQSSMILAKPMTFMNNSGLAVQKLATYYHIQTTNLWVIHDDLDIKLGSYKIQFGVGPKVHNGLLSIYEKLGTKDFWHVRVGVDNRNQENRMNGEEYVLQKFKDDEKEILEKVVDEIVEKLAVQLFKN